MKWVEEPIDLEYARKWLIDVQLIICIFAIPPTITVSLPVFLKEKLWGLIFGLGVLGLFVIIALFSKGMTLRTKGFLGLFLLFLYTTSHFIVFGPKLSGSALLVMSAVMAALFFNIRAVVAIILINAFMLMFLYGVLGFGNSAWAGISSAAFNRWVMFVINVSVISLVTSLPLSFLLKKLNNSIKEQQRSKLKIQQEAEKVKKAHEDLKNEIKDRCRAEVSLKKSEELLSKLVTASPDIIVQTDVNKKVTFINERGFKLAGFDTAEEMIGRSFLNFVVPEEIQRISDNHQKAFDYPHGPQVYDFLTKDGVRISLEVNTDVLRQADGTPYGTVNICRDITERKEAEDVVRESEEKYRNILENIAEGYYEVNCSGNLTFFNDSLCNLLGYSRDELMGMNNRQYTDEKNAAILYKTFNQVYQKGEATASFEIQVIRKDGSTGFGEISVSPIWAKEGEIIGFRGMARDITDRKRIEEEQEKLVTQLQQAQKMEAIGTLAGGIAHDFNNILTAIIGNAELALINITDKNPLHPYLMQVQESSRRAADLVRQILTFSRQKGQEPEPIQPGSIVKETLKMLRSTLPSTVKIQQHIEDDPGLILADPTQIHQILMNLSTNAAHAMRENGGLLEVLMDHINLTAEEILHYSGLDPGPYLRLSVRDTGQGMTPEVMEHIFDPYFTTKKVGEGTGLGLAVVYGIVKKSNGDIKVYSEPGKGSLFEILLPRVEWMEDAPPPKEPETIPRGTERILLVDDEKDLINIFQKMLSGLGYRVTSTLNSMDALEIFKARPEEFDAVITDMTMPQQTGTELARRIKQIRADIPIILSTGYSDLIDEKKVREFGIQAFLMKPVGREMLSKTLRRLLDEKRRVDEELIGTRH